MLYFKGSGCGAKTVYATVRSDCAGPLEGVKFTSTELMGVSSNYPGSYRLTVCTVPTDITCEKEGHEPVTQRVTRSSMLIQMTCTGTILNQNPAHQSVHPHSRISVLLYNNCTPEEKLNHWLPLERPSHTLIRLRRCTTGLLLRVRIKNQSSYFSVKTFVLVLKRTVSIFLRFF